MSVINKMLRDLDQRQAAAGSGQAIARTPAALGATIPVLQRKRLGPWIWGIALALVGLLAWAAWMLANPSLSGAVPAPPAASPAAVTAAIPAPSPAPAASEPASVASAPARVLIDGHGDVQLRMENALSAQSALDALALTPPPAPVRAQPSVVAQSALTAKPQPVPGTPAATAPRPIPPSTPAEPASRSTIPLSSHTAIARRAPLAGAEALAQAQSLWNGGSADAAIEVLTAALGVAETQIRAGTDAAGNPALLTLVREWTRMQLASGRYGAVWEMLTRMEPVLGATPDIWAIRANAAQRIGRHQDSVHAYMAALQVRPDEQRWLLGAAVSLAAMGQTTSAAELVSKARALGPINKSIAAYLRQSGVSLPD